MLIPIRNFAYRQALVLGTVLLASGCPNGCEQNPSVLKYENCADVIDVDSIATRQYSIAPYLINPSADGVTIQWEAMDDAPSYLLWGPQGQYTTCTCLPAPTKIPIVSDEITEPHKGWLYSVTLHGLDAHSRYQYTVPGSQVPIPDPDEVYTGEYRWKDFGQQIFTTAAAVGQDFSIIVYGDNQPLAHNHQLVIDAILRHPADVVLHVGDIVHNGSIGQFRGNYFRMASPALRMIPHFHIAGNHEGHGDVIPFDTLFPMPVGETVNDAAGMAIEPGPRAGVFDYGNARFFALDTERDIGAGSVQLAWLDAQLENAVHNHPEIKWLFTTWHRPTYSLSESLMDGPRDAVDVVLKRWHVDAVFTGHNHCYERLVHDGMTFVVAGGGGAALTNVDIREPANGEVQEAAAAAFSFLRGEFHGDSASFTAYKAEDDAVIDSFVLQSQDRSEL